MPIIDLIDQELAVEFKKFVAGGGLDATKVVSEDFERELRQASYCQHGRVKIDCKACKSYKSTIVGN